MEPIESGAELRVELFVREELPKPTAERVESLWGAVSGLEGAAAIDELERATWRKRVPIGQCDGDLRDRYLDFQSWADDAGVRLSPFFGTRECYTPAAGEFRDWLVLPAVCLAVYQEGDLEGVYPHRDGESTVTVEDAIETLEETRSRRGDGTGARVAVGD